MNRAPVVGPLGEDLLAFVDAEGELKADTLAGYVSKLRRVGVNAEFNGACRGLLSVRFDLETPFVPKLKASSKAPDRNTFPDIRVSDCDRLQIRQLFSKKVRTSNAEDHAA